ncbi:hypothetical protein L2E82_53431 [Cichorium intybus]|nr:hypothetical protein L2E82_53431 [Cichorium intybus]
MEPFPSSGLQSSHLNICYYHQDPHRRPPPPRLTPKVLQRPPRPPTHRGLALAPTPGVGRALKRHPFSGLVDSAGMLTLEPFSEDQGRSAVHPARGIPPISFLAPCGFTHRLTRTHVRLLGPVFKTGRMGCPQAGAGSTQVYRRDGACCQPRSTATASPRAYRQLGLWPPHQSAPVHAPSRSADRLSPFHIRPGRIAGPHSLPSRQFQALFDSLFKVLFIFPSRVRARRGLSLSGAPFQGTWARSAAEDASPDYNSDSEAARFSSWADPGSLAVTKGILVHVHGSFCFAGFDNDPSQVHLRKPCYDFSFL